MHRPYTILAVALVALAAAETGHAQEPQPTPTRPAAVAAAAGHGAMTRAGTAHTRRNPWHRPKISGLLRAEL